MDIMKINTLPEDMVGEIYSFLPSKFFNLCNKRFWEINYKEKMTDRYSPSYCRFLLRHDYDFIFKEYLVYNSPVFIQKKKKIFYQNKVFPRKIELIKYLSSFVFDSQKCTVIINKFMRTHRLVFKKIKTRFNKWTN
jgi:hypothetical protein